MNVRDFFYLERYDRNFISNFLNKLLNQKLLTKHYSKDGSHYFEIKFILTEKFLLEHFNTSDINDITLLDLSNVCVANAISIQPLCDLINDVRSKSNYYPMLTHPRVRLNEDNDAKIIEICYSITIALIPDHL